MSDRTRDSVVGRGCEVPEIGPPAGVVAWRLDLGDGQELALFEFPTSGGCPREAGVTAAERVVLGLAVAGLSNWEIAATRRVSPHTVANQLASVFRKLGVRSRLELQAWVACRTTTTASPARSFPANAPGASRSRRSRSRRSSRS
jgi:DNA-binding CsgD family transcriptional regulator